VHDCNNVGIDFIGYEGSAPTLALDRARHGVCVGKTIWNIDSAFNPAHGGNFSTGGGGTSAAGIYVDGGTQILIERNHVFRCNFGVELASEAASGFTDYITLRCNLLHHNQVAGLTMGGYDRLRGQTQFCQISGNTFYQNDTLPSPSYAGQIALQFYVSHCSFRNNIVWANYATMRMWLHYPGTGWLPWSGKRSVPMLHWITIDTSARRAALIILSSVSSKTVSSNTTPG
jgi:hypothetical protein